MVRSHPLPPTFAVAAAVHGARDPRQLSRTCCLSQLHSRLSRRSDRQQNFAEFCFLTARQFYRQSTRTNALRAGRTETLQTIVRGHPAKIQPPISFLPWNISVQSASVATGRALLLRLSPRCFTDDPARKVAITFPPFFVVAAVGTATFLECEVPVKCTVVPSLPFD